MKPYTSNQAWAKLKILQKNKFARDSIDRV